MQKMKKRSAALKLGLAAASALALTFGAASPAFAGNIAIGPDAIMNYENGNEDEHPGAYNYHEWHIGSNYESGVPLGDSVTVNECSITTLAHPSAGSVIQVLKGYEPDGRPTTGETVEPLVNALDSVSITVLKGSVTIQVPFFVYPAGDDAPGFTTVRSVGLEAGTYKLSDLLVEDSGTWIDEPITVGAFLEGLQGAVDDNAIYEILGFGFTGSAGAEVASMSFGGDTYFFGTGSCTPGVTPTPTPAPAPTPPAKVETAAK